MRKATLTSVAIACTCAWSRFSTLIDGTHFARHVALPHLPVTHLFTVDLNDDSRAGRVLVIEDDDLLRDLIGQFLKAQGCEVVEADSVQSARIALATQQYDVVVTDVHLPDGVSIDIIQELHEKRPEIPVVFITGDVDRRLASKVLKTEPSAFLIKPFEFPELQSVVLHALREARGNAVVEPRPLRGLQSHDPIPLVIVPQDLEDHDRSMPLGMMLRIVATVGVMLIIAFLLGRMLMP